MRLTCYRLSDDVPRLVAARADRQWMDDTRMRFAYRCLPLNIANGAGWEMLCPMEAEISWNGGPELADLTVAGPDRVDRFYQSHFGHGVLTMHTHYLFRTEPGFALWVRGSPNLPKDGIHPLDGIVETDWLNFTFTMNWIMTRPGSVRFACDEPFCFITPFAYRSLDAVVPEIVPISANPELAAAFEEQRTSRNDFNARLAANDPEANRQKWQKWYMRGQHPTGQSGNELHLSKLRVADPVEPGAPSTSSGGPNSSKDN